MTQPARRLVIGMGASGFSMAAYWHRQFALTSVDDRSEPPRKEMFQRLLPAVHSCCGENFRNWAADDFLAYDKIAVSPGIAPDDIRAPAELLTNDAACFSEAWQREAPAGSRLLAITGTNGKSTVAALAEHLINSAGMAAQAVGNIGTPMLDALLHWRTHGFPAVAVVELSSFHLELARDFKSDAAVVLNIGADHLDRHGTVENYANIKCSLYGSSRRNVVNADALPCAGVTAAVSYAEDGKADADWTISGGWICCRGARRHPLAALSETCRNSPALALAALALIDSLALPDAGVQAGLASFAGLPHRRQVVATHGGVVYVDDSKATNVEAALHAVRQVAAGKAVWIGGGDGKGQDFSRLASLAPSLRAAVLIGRDAEAIAAALAAAAVPCQRAADMESAVRAARAAAQEGDTVLLSPACSSLDMFADYRARGMAFSRAVRGQINVD